MTNSRIRRIAVYCGSSPGSDPRFVATARELGHQLARRGIGVVYGGAAVGCMGALADGALEAGGEVVGVLTKGLAEREIAHKGLTVLEIVDSMHERKARMSVLSDAVIALPGGFGTFDELFEPLTWSQLQIAQKPIGLLDAQGFWDPMLRLLDGAVAAGFLQPQNRALIHAEKSLDPLLHVFTAAAALYAARRAARGHQPTLMP